MTWNDLCECGHPESDHQPEFGCWAEDCECLEFDDEDDPTPPPETP